MNTTGKAVIVILELAAILMLTYAQTTPQLTVIKTNYGYVVTNVTESSGLNVSICGKSLYVIEEVANSTYAKLRINHFEYSLQVGSKQSIYTMPQNCYVELLNNSGTSAPNTASLLFSENASNITSISTTINISSNNTIIPTTTLKTITSTTINTSSKSTMTTASATTAKTSIVQPTINVTTVAVSKNSTQTSANSFKSFWNAIVPLFSKFWGKI